MEAIKQKKELKISPESQVLIEDMFKVGIHLGHNKSKRHPKMADYIFATRHNINLIDLTKTVEKFKEVVEYMDEVLKKGNLILFVGTNPALRDLIKKTANHFNQPFVIERWLGGTLTNFKTVSKRMNYFENLLNKKDSGELEKYTKKEQLVYQRELSVLEKKFGGLRLLKKLPETVFIVDVNKHEAAVKEARKIGIKIIAFVDTDANPELIDYPIPANDGTRKAVEFLLNKLIADVKVNPVK